MMMDLPPVGSERISRNQQPPEDDSASAEEIDQQKQHACYPASRKSTSLVLAQSDSFRFCLVCSDL